MSSYFNYYYKLLLFLFFYLGLISSAAGSNSSVSANCRKLEDPVYKKAKLSHSIAKDQTATNVYKSLFTSHEDDKNQTRAHWITYNPFYN